MENVYEALFILDSNKYSRDATGLSTQLREAIQKHGGTVLVHRLWEERRLAYPINGQRKGTYWLSYFRMDSQNLQALHRDYHLNENVLRTLILKIEPRLVEPLIAHAQAGPATASAPAPGPRREAALPPVPAEATIGE